MSHPEVPAGQESPGAAADRLAPRIQAALDDYSAAMCGPKPGGGGWCRVERQGRTDWVVQGSQGTYLFVRVVGPQQVRLSVVHPRLGASPLGQPPNVSIISRILERVTHCAVETEWQVAEAPTEPPTPQT